MSAMERPRAANDLCEFASAFALLVTSHSSYHYDWVARKGRNSIFSLFCQVAQEKVSNCWQRRSDWYQNYLMPGNTKGRHACVDSIQWASLRFSIQQKIILDVVLNKTWRSISEAKFNSLLEKVGLRRVRVRMQCTQRYMHDLSPRCLS